MATTPEGTPYVESSDLVANYPAASLALANRVDLVGVLPFATSAARATAIPSPTDGQYSYLQDSNTTQFWNGSAWQTAGLTPGLNLVTPTSIANTTGSASITGGEVTFTGVTSLSLNGVFTSTYSNYRILFSGQGSTSVSTTMRLRASGTDNTGSNYKIGRYYVGVNQSQVAGNTNNDTSTGFGFVIMQVSTTSNGSIDLFDPQKASVTSGNLITGGSFLDIYGYSHTQATSYDGFTVFVNVGNMTGKVRVYGYLDQ